MAMASFSDTDVTVPLKKYDVFISFRGEDTRAGFTSHLHSALCQSYFHTYIDNRIEKGDEVWAELVKAIKESTLFLVVFSENYASSTWCLNELVEIMECKKNGQIVFPVFYHIDPSHVRKQTGSYHTGLAEHKKHSKEKMQKWKDALCEAANLSGFHSSKYRTESNLIEDIIKAVKRNLNHRYTTEFRCHFIPDENYSRIESLIKIGSREVQIIGLWGMGGIGKTTLAAALFHKVSSQYEGSCFFENVTEESKRHGFNYICNKLLSTLLGEDLGIVTIKVIPSIVMRRLRSMKAFIVLDNLNTSELLENLVGVGRDWLGAGSRVIVTTRDKNVLVSGGVDEIHEVLKMNFQNSIRLFSLNAFNETRPKQGYEDVSERALVYAKGIPLVLKVLGSFLRSKSGKEWDSALTKLKDIPNAEIQKVLRMSYDELDDTEKNIFLDIACFFKGYGRDQVTKILNACGFFADIGIRNLLNKALITVASCNSIHMHDLIQEMGKEIVRGESIKNAGQRSRLWVAEEVCEVLTNNRGTMAVEAIFLDVTQITQINLSSKAFKKMPNLRLLAFMDHKGMNSIYLPRGLDSLPMNLRYFRWDGYSLRSLPSTFCPEMFVELCLRDSTVEKLWNGIQNLPNLETLDLRGSKHLIECPNLSGAPNLKHVRLQDCERLPSVDPSIFSLQKLEVLYVNGCTSLKSLSSNTCPPSLRTLSAQDCVNLQEFSVPLMPGKHLVLSLGWWGLNELPSSILHLKNLGSFFFPISDNLMGLPENFAHTILLSKPEERECDILGTLSKILPSPAFVSVKRLGFRQCDSLVELPENISFLSSLECLILFDIAIISLPQTIKYLPRLKHIDFGECKRLRSIPALPPSIQSFRVWNCESLQTVTSLTSAPSEKSLHSFILPNCIKLDQHLYDTILKDAIVRVELGARLHTTISANKEDASLYHDDHHKFYRIWYFLPAMSGKVQHLFHYHSTQALVSVELPPNVLGFVYYMVLSQGRIGYGGRFGCECYLETSSGGRINVTSFIRDEIAFWFNRNGGFGTTFNITLDHVILWHDAQCCKKIMKAVEERKAINDVSTSYNPKLTFVFFAEALYDEVVIKECGFRWIYSSEDKIVTGEEGRCKSKRSRKIYELEANAVQNRAEGSESDEQEEIIPPTKKLKQHIFETLSNPEADQEIEELRYDTTPASADHGAVEERPIGPVQAEVEAQTRPKRKINQPPRLKDYVCYKK